MMHNTSNLSFREQVPEREKAALHNLIMEPIPNGQRPTAIRIDIPTSQALPVMINYNQLLAEKKEKIPLSAMELADRDMDYEFRRLMEEQAAQNDYRDDDDDDINSDDLDSEDDHGDGERRIAEHEYDVDDPFIDDSDMLLDNPCEISAPERQGYFVYYGAWKGDPNEQKEEEEIEKKAPKKRSTKPKAPPAPPKKDKPTKAAPVKRTPETIELSDDDDIPGLEYVDDMEDTQPTPGGSTQFNKKERSVEEDRGWDVTLDRKSSTPTQEGGSHEKKKKAGKVALAPLSPEVQALMDKLDEDVKHESFENKARFPTSLRPAVLEAGAIVFRQLNMIDDNLVGHLMRILPYNRFTLRKYIITKAGPGRLAELQREIDTLEAQLKAKVDKAMPEQLRLHQEKVTASRAEGLPDRPEENPALVKKFKWTDEERQIVFEIIKNVNAITTITNEIGSFAAKPPPTVAEVSARKLMYLRLLPCWPDGWMATIEMSRQLSQYKVKEGKKVQQDETRLSQNQGAAPQGVKRSVSMTFGPEPPRQHVSPSLSIEPVRKKVSPFVPSKGVPPITSQDRMLWQKSPSMKIESLISKPAEK
ncbi:hypothetical protein F4703DRAFT_1831468 [Phycomyces blakesleeanus]